MPDDKKTVSENINSKGYLRKLQDMVSNITKVSDATHYSTYNITRDMYGTDKIMQRASSLNDSQKAKLKSTVDNNNLALNRISPSMPAFMSKNAFKRNKFDKDGKLIKGDVDSIFDAINQDTSIFNELRQQLMMNNKFYDDIQEYEILRRSIPEISRVIKMMINSILTPEAITTKIYNLSYNLNDVHTELASKLDEKYELDKKIRVIIENFLMIGVEYITVVPYKIIIDALKANGTRKDILKESSLGDYSTKSNNILTESVNEYIQDNIVDNNVQYMRDSIKVDNSIQLNKYGRDIQKHIDGIKIYKSNKCIAYDEALIESTINNGEFMLESSFDTYFDSAITGMSKKKSNKNIDDGVINDGDYDNINMKGCKIERLDPSRVYPIKLNDTVIVYVYIQERRDDYFRYNLRSGLNDMFSFYKYTNENSKDIMMKQVEDKMIKEIGNRILSSITPKFLETNLNDMDIFYEFLRDHELHANRHEIILLHPDDVIEFKRTDGSIMRNSIFFARLYLMLMLNNILTKVRKGSDRTLFYVNPGMSTDIQGAVTEAINSITQSEIRMSDTTSMKGVLTAVGSVVDLFLPQSSDGEKPIQSEVIGGQQVDMNDEFMQYLIKSIIMSFGIPPVVVDGTNDIDFAKTLSMANLEIANTVALEQAEINKPLTKLLRRVLAYDLNLSKDEIDSITATLIPPKSILIQLANEQLQTVKELGTNMADLNITSDDDVDKKLFVKRFVRDHWSYEWAIIDAILNEIAHDKVEHTLKEDLTTPEIDTSELDADMNDGGGDGMGTGM